MRRPLWVVFVAVLLLGATPSARAFVVRLQCANVDGTAASRSATITNTSDGFIPLDAATSPEATYIVFRGNVPSSDPADWGYGLRVLDSSGPYRYYGRCIGRGGYSGPFDLRFYGAGITTLPSGVWYLYRGLYTVPGQTCRLLDTGVFTTTETTWATSTFGAVLNDGDCWTLSTIPPGNQPQVFDDGDTTVTATSFHAAWNYEDPAAVSGYYYAIGTSQDSLVVGWNSASAATEITVNGLNLVDGQTYFCYVRMHYTSGAWSDVGSSDGIRVTLPAVPVVQDEDDYRLHGSPVSLHAQWVASDSLGVQEYQYAIGTSLENLLVDWTSTGTVTSATESGISLELNRTYYWYVKARNGGGFWSTPGVSNGVTGARTASIPEARSSCTGSAVIISGVPSSTPEDLPSLWLGTDDRSSAIFAPATWAVQRGDRVAVAGIAAWIDGVPLLANPELKSQQSGSAQPKPWGLSNWSLAADPAESLTYNGINPVGLLVTTWGKVTRVNTALHVLYIDDGSGLTDGMGPSDYPYVGLRVAYKAGWTPPAVGKMVRVTGIRSVEKTVLQYDAFVNGVYRFAGEVLYVPILVLRDEADVRIINRT